MSRLYFSDGSVNVLVLYYGVLWCVLRVGDGGECVERDSQCSGVCLEREGGVMVCVKRVSQCYDV